MSQYPATHKFSTIGSEASIGKLLFVTFKNYPLYIIYSMKDPDLQVSYLNTLITDCLNKHAPLKCVKVTRPPAPWMKELDIVQLQQECRDLRLAAHQDSSECKKST